MELVVLKMEIYAFKWFLLMICFCSLVSRPRCLSLSSSGISSTVGSPGQPWSISGISSSSTWCSPHSLSSSLAPLIKMCQQKPFRIFLSFTWTGKTQRHVSHLYTFMHLANFFIPHASKSKWFSAHKLIKCISWSCWFAFNKHACSRVNQSRGLKATGTVSRSLIGQNINRTVNTLIETGKIVGSEM